jgi:uncharacterized protein (TIGR03435 family)
MMRLRNIALFACIAAMSVLHAQTQATASPLAYDIISIHQADPDSDSGGIDPLPSGVGYNAINVTVRDMLSVMYRIPKRQIVRGPGWIHSERFNVLVRADHRYSIDELHTMFQNALVERFHLKIHIETRIGPVYALRVSKPGLKMIPVDEGFNRNRPILTDDENEYTGDRVPLNYLCFWLGMKLQNDHRPVIDKTGLSGHYNFKLAFRPQLPPDAKETIDFPSIFDAVKNQLGLRLVSEQGPIQTIVIDHAEKPSPN